MDCIHKSKRAIAIGLIILTVIATYFKIRVGLDNDEVFIIYLSSRIAQGKILFKDSWDIYVTTAVIPAILIKIYTLITHSFEGVVIYLRVISAIVQFALAYISYVILKRHYSKEAAFSAAIVVANLLPRATQNFEYGFNTMAFFLIMSLMLFDVFNNDRNGNIKVLAAGISYGMAVFVYPTMLISLPYILFLLIVKIHPNIRHRIRYSLIFGGGAASSSCCL